MRRTALASLAQGANDVRLVQANPHAPPAYNGVGEVGPAQRYFDQSFDYVHDVILTANQLLDDEVGIDDDADFAWRALVIVAQTGAFNVRFSDSNWYFLQSGLASSALFAGDASSPFAIWPEIMIPAGGRIGMQLQDTSAAGNTIQMSFRGVKRYAVAV